MAANVARLPVSPPDPALETDGKTILFASLLLRSGATSAMAFEDAARWPVFLPVAETMERIETADDVADVSRSMIRAASRR